MSVSSESSPRGRESLQRPHDDREVLTAQGGSRYRYLLELALEVEKVS